MQLHPRTFNQSTGFNLNCSWYLTIIICQHVRAISKKNSYPNSQIKLSTWFHPLFPKWSTPIKGCWAPREYSGYKYNVQPHHLSYQRLFMETDTFSEMLNTNGMVMQQITYDFIVCCVQASFKPYFHFLWHRGLSYGTQFYVFLYQLNKMSLYEDWICQFCHQNL